MDTFLSTLGTATGTGIIELVFLLIFGSTSLLAIGAVLGFERCRKILAPAYIGVVLAMHVVNSAYAALQEGKLTIRSVTMPQAVLLSAAMLASGLFAAFVISAMLGLLATFGNFR